MRDTEVKKRPFRELTLKDIFNTRNKRFSVYYLLVLLELYVFSILFTASMEYYMTNPSRGFFSYVFYEFFLFYFYEIPKAIFIFPDILSASFYHAFSIIITLIVLSLVFSVFQRGYIAVFITGLAGMVLCYASKIKFQNRMELLNIKDLALTEAAGMAKNYLTFNFGLRFLGMLSIVTAFTILAFFTDRIVKSDRRLMVKKEKVRFWLIRIALGLIMIAALFHYQSRINNSLMKGDLSSRLLMMSDQPSDFVVFRFLENKTTAYTAEVAQKTYQEIITSLNEQYISQKTTSCISKESYPNVIVVMNESWWRMDQADPNKMVFSADPFGPIKELGGIVKWGSASVNVFGGGTISSEVEFLTGWNSKYFRNSISVADDQSDQKIHSVVEYFNDLGYDTHAIHPFWGNFYSRQDIYKNMGFDHITFDSDMEYRELFDRYISDGSLADQIIYEFENRSAEKAFIFSVSVASHTTFMDYPTPFNDNYPYIVSIEVGNDWAPSEEWTEARHASFKRQINGVYEASAAYAKLVNYFEKQSEPVVLIMFGDHCPAFSFSDLKDVGILNGIIDSEWRPSTIRQGFSDDTIGDIQKLYSVPVVCWSNCLEDYDMDMDLNNLCILSSRLIQKCNLPMTKMSLLENYYESQLAADNMFYLLDKDHNLIFQTNEEIEDSVRIKTLIQYDQMFGDDVCGDLWIPMRD